MPKPSTLRKTPLLALASIRRIELVLVGDADVEVAVGGEDDAVGAPLDEVLRRPCRRRAGCPRRRWSSRRPAAGRAPRGSRPCRRTRSRAGPGPTPPRRRRSPPGRSRRAARPASAATPSPAAACSGWSIEPGDVDQEDEVARRPPVAGRSAWPVRPIRASRCSAFQGQPATSTWTANGVVARRGRVVVGEVVEQLLDPDRVLRRQRALVEEPADVGVAGGVDVDRERRERLVPDAEERVVDDVVVILRARDGARRGGLAGLCSPRTAAGASERRQDRRLGVPVVESAEITSPPARVSNAPRTVGAIVSLTNRTDPSRNSMLDPPS